MSPGVRRRTHLWRLVLATVLVAVALLLLVLGLPSVLGHGRAASAPTSAVPATRHTNSTVATGTKGTTPDTTLTHESLTRQTTQQLVTIQSQLRAALDIRNVPGNVEPSISGAATDGGLMATSGCLVTLDPTTSPACVFGDTKSSRIVVLFGDSHAAQWFPALEPISVQQGWRLVVLAKQGCSPPDVLVKLDHSGGTPYSACNQWRAYAEQRIKALRPWLIVVSWDRHISIGAQSPPPQAGMAPPPTSYGSPWLDGEAATLSVLKATGARIVFISDTPIITQDVPTCLAAHLTDAAACAQPAADAVFDPSLKAAEIKVATSLGAKVIEPVSWFCTPKACPVIVGNIIVYRDTHHLTPQIVSWLEPMLRLQLLMRLT